MTSTSVQFDILARDKASKAFRDVGSAADRSASKAAKFGGVLAKAGLAFGAVAAAAGIFTFKVGSSYVASLNQIQALTGANNQQMDAAAKLLESNAGAYAKMGQTTGDAASGVVELTKSGLSLHDALSAVYGTMTLAKAGELDVADASSITANALNTFHLKAKQAGDVANYLANAANISSADVSDLAESFKYVAPVAAAAGVSIKQTNAILAELANAGIKGSQAGTALRTFLLNLQAPAAAGAAVMKDLGIQVFDASGKMKPLGDVIGQLSGQLNGLPAEQKAADLKALFGKTGIAGATTILNEGVNGLKEYTKGIGRAGAASKLAESKSKGLAGSFNTIKSSAISGAQSVYRQFSPLADKVVRPLAQKFADFASNLGPKMATAFGKIGDLFRPLLEKIDIKGLGTKLADQAKSWAGPVIGGFNAGLNSGDWSGLGKALGNGIIKAAGALGDISGKLGDVLSKIDWVGIGIAMGKQAPSLFVGLAAGILNFDLMNLLKGVGAHWLDVLLAVLAIAFTPGKIVGKVAEMLSRIPLVGKLLAWGLLSLKGWGDGMKGAVWDAIKFMGRQFLEGFRRVFPETGKAFSEALHLFPLRIALMGIELQERALKMVFGIGRGISRGIGNVVAKIGELTAKMLRPFAGAAGWLVDRGVQLLTGLLHGITSQVGEVLAPIKSLGGRFLGAAAKFGRLLYDSGVQLIQGLINGIGAKLGELMGKVNSIASSVKGAFQKAMGIFSPSRVFHGYGENLMQGLVNGITKGFVPVKTALAKVTDYMRAQASKLRDLFSAKASFAQGFQSFTTSVFSTDLSQTTTDASGNDVTTPASVGDMIAYQQQQRDKARQLRGDVRKLHKMGLSNALIKQLQASGEAGMAQIHTLAGGSRADIRKLNALNKQTEGALHGAGEIAGGQLYNSRIRQRQNNEDLAERIAKKLHAALKDAAKGEELVIKDTNGQWIIKAIRREKRHKGDKSAV